MDTTIEVPSGDTTIEVPLGATLTTTLDDCFYATPKDPNDLILHHKEYTSMVSTKDLLQPPKGFFFPYQEQQTRYHLIASKILCMDGPGVGKTFKAIETALMLIGRYDPTLPRDPHLADLPSAVRQYLEPMRQDIQKVYYLTINKTLLNQAKDALALCLNGSAIDTSIFTFSTYDEFVGDVKKNLISVSMKEYHEAKSGKNLKAAAVALQNVIQSLRHAFSRSYFVLDEAHRISGENIAALKPMDLGRRYTLINLLLKSIENSVITVFTATPITNHIREIIPVINLIIDEPMDVVEQRFLQAPKPVAGEEVALSTDLDAMTLPDLQRLLHDKLSGKVIFVPSRASGFRIQYQGEPMEETPFAYVPCVMSGKQLEQNMEYMRGTIALSITVTREGEETDVSQQDSIYSTEIAIGMCYVPFKEQRRARSQGKTKIQLVPDTIYYEANHPIIEAMAVAEEARIQSKNPNTTRKNIEIIRRLENVPYIFDEEKMASYGVPKEQWLLDTQLQQLSSKYYEALRILRDNPGKVTIAYFRTIVHSGLGAFVAIAQLNGYERYTETLEDPVHGNTIDLEPKRRLVVLTSEMKPATVILFLRIVSHPSNWDGRYIELVCLSPGMKVGLSIFNVRRFFHMGSDWNPWNYLQSSYRGIREGGMQAILKETGLPTADYEIYSLCSVFPTRARKELRREGHKKSRAFLEPNFPTRVTTLDQDMYEIVRRRYVSHIRPIRILEQMSVVAPLNRIRYDHPVYKSDGNQSLITNTFHVLYSRRYVYALKEYIKRQVILNLEPIALSTLVAKTAMYGIPLRLYNRAIAELIEEHGIFTNHLGSSVYIGWDGQYVYQQSAFAILGQGDAMMSYYTQYIPISFSNQNVQMLVFDLDRAVMEEVVSKKTVARLRSYLLKHVDTRTQIAILETALIETYTNQPAKNPYKNRADFLERSGRWKVTLETYRIYWYFWPHPFLAPGLWMAHSFIAFLGEAGYPIIPRMKSPNRYRYYTTSWHTTEEHSEVTRGLYRGYTQGIIEETILPRTQQAPYAYRTLCDAVFRVVLTNSQDPQHTRGKNINAMSYVDLVDVLVRLDRSLGIWNQEEKRYRRFTSKTRNYESDAFEKFPEDQRPTLEWLANLLSDPNLDVYQSRDTLQESLIKVFGQHGLVIEV